MFFTILNNRLTKFTIEKNLLSESQLGFIQGNRTSDPHIILHNLIQKYCQWKKGKLYGCFVDFSKAFDNVSGDILLSKLDTLGVYCVTNKLSINTNKTECMIFNKTGRLMGHKFFFKDTLIRNVRKYKYLGFLVTPSGEIRSGLEDLRIRALKALMKIKAALGSLFRKKHNKYYSPL